MHWLRKWLIPPRLHLFEFCDQTWLRGLYREAFMDALGFIFRFGGVHRNLGTAFAKWSGGGTGAVLDIGSGAAGPHGRLLRDAQAFGWNLPQMILSDLNPVPEAYRRLQERHPASIQFLERPFNALEAAAHPAKNISVLCVLHHLPPRVVQKVIAECVESKQGLFIYEVFSRHWPALFLSLVSIIPMMLAPFFATRFHWRKFLWTSLIPVIPLMVAFDGMVSVLRTYRPEEILEMVPEELRGEWRFKVNLPGWGGLHGGMKIAGRRVVTQRAIALGSVRSHPDAQAKQGNPIAQPDVAIVTGNQVMAGGVPV